MSPVISLRWVPVREALPETLDRVLVTDGLLTYEASLDNAGRWRRSGNWMPMENLLVHPVSHWMKLPAAPGP